MAPLLMRLMRTSPGIFGPIEGGLKPRTAKPSALSDPLWVQAQAGAPVESLRALGSPNVPTFVGSDSQKGITNLFSVQPTRDAGAQVGDLMLTAIGWGGGHGALEPADGWTLEFDFGPSTNFSVYSRICAVGDPDNWEWRWALNQDATVVLIVYRGADRIQLVTGTDSSGSVNRKSPSMEVAVPNAGLLLINMNLNGTISPAPGPPAWTERIEVGNPGVGGVDIEAQDLLASNASGTKGPYPFTSSFAQNMQMFLFALLPPAQAGVASIPIESTQKLGATAVPAYRDVSNADSNGVGVTSWSVAKPAALADGDFLILILRLSGAQSPGFPPGFSQPIAGLPTNMWVLTKAIPLTPGSAAAEPATYDFTGLGSRQANLVAIAYSGVDPAIGVHKSIVVTDNASPHLSGDLDVAIANCGLVLVASNGNHDTASPAAGWTERIDSPSPGGFQAIEVQDLLAANDKGGKGPYTFTTPANNQERIILMALAPRAQAGVMPIPIEYLMGVKSGSNAQIEPSGSVGQTGSFPIESLKGLAITVVSPWESLAIINPATAALAYETLLGVKQSGGDPLESLGAVKTTAPSPLESSSLTAAQTGTFPFEQLSAVATVTVAPFEALQGIASQLLASLENLKGLAPIASLPLESQGALAAVCGAPIESLLGLRTVNGAPIESLAVVTANAQSILEALQGLASSKGGPWESLAGLRSLIDAPWESIGTAGNVTQIATLPIEWTSKVNQSIAVPYEYLEGIQALLGSPQESLGALQRLAGAPLESLVSLSQSSGIPLEALVQLRVIAGLPIEWWITPQIEGIVLLTDSAVAVITLIDVATALTQLTDEPQGTVDLTDEGSGG